MAPLICPLLTCTSPIPPTARPILQPDIIDHLREEHGIQPPATAETLAALRERRQRAWQFRWEAADERLDEKARLRAQRWEGFQEAPSRGVPAEVECGKGHAEMAMLAEVDDDEVRGKAAASSPRGKVGRSFGDREEDTKGYSFANRIRRRATEDRPVSKAKVERLAQHLREALVAEDRDGLAEASPAGAQKQRSVAVSGVELGDIPDRGAGGRRSEQSLTKSGDEEQLEQAEEPDHGLELDLQMAD